MGKMTEALKKIEKQRENVKHAWQGAGSILKKQKDKLFSDRQEAETEEKQTVTNRLTLEERIKEVGERLKNRVYIAKATDESGMDPRVVTYFKPSSSVSEQYRILRTNILSKSSNKSTKTFLISSSLYGEGKTVTAVNLAVALAQDLDKKVLLADCDLRGGNIHKLLNLSLSPGLSDVLMNNTDLEDASYNSKIKNLTILPRGDFPPNPSELLGSKKMRRILEELKSSFDYIILDSPPVIHITDAVILGAQCDGVMFVVQAQKTQERLVKRAQELLQQAQVKIIGFVLTQVDYYSPGYYSYYNHYNNKAKGEKAK